MRRLSRSAVVAALAGLVTSAACGGVRSCKKGTALVAVHYAAGLPTVASVAVTVSDRAGDGGSVTLGAPRPGGDSVEVDFAAGYPVGATLTVSAIARDASGATVGAGDAMVTLAAGCAAIEVTVEPGGGDGGPPRDAALDGGPSDGPRDGGPADLLALDAATCAPLPPEANLDAAAPAAGALALLAGQRGGPGFADGVGGRSRLNLPWGIAWDGTRKLFYVADDYNRLVRTFDPATGAVGTLIGVLGQKGNVDGPAGTALLAAPTGLALDGSATTLYLTDQDAQVVRAITLPTTTSKVATIATIAGQNGVAGHLDGAVSKFSSPLGIAWDGGVLYVADSGNDAIRVLTSSANGWVSSSIGGGATGYQNGPASVAEFNGPTAVAADHAGHLYVSDAGNTAIRLITLAGGATVSLLAGQPGKGPNLVDGSFAAAQFLAPLSLTLDGAGRFLFVGDTAVRRLDLQQKVVNTIAGSASPGPVDGVGPNAGFTEPTGLAFDAVSGLLYVTDSRGDEKGSSFPSSAIRRIDTSCGGVSTVAGVSGNAGFDLAPSVAGAAAHFSAPFNVAASTSTLYVSDSKNNVVRAIDLANGQVRVYAGDPQNRGFKDGTPGALNNPLGVALDAGGTLFVGDNTNHAIRTVDKSGALATLCGNGTAVAGPTSATPCAMAAFISAYALVADGANRLYVADPDAQVVRRIDLKSGGASTVTDVVGTFGMRGATDGLGTAALLSGPEGLAFDGPRHLLYIAETGNETIRRVDVANNYAVTTIAGTTGRAGYVDDVGASALLHAPRGIALDATGASLYVADSANGAIRLVATASPYRVTSLVNRPTAMGLPTATAVLEGPLAQAALNAPTGVALVGTTLYAVDQHENVVVEVR